MRWKGRVGPTGGDGDGNGNGDGAVRDDDDDDVVETNTGYLVFSGRDCKAFKGTVSCACAGLDNAAVVGRKVTSKATQCPVRWAGFAS